MIEAMPSVDEVVLIITKVNNPEELDDKVSQFTGEVIDTSSNVVFPQIDGLEKLDGADRMVELLKTMKDTLEKIKKRIDGKPKSEKSESLKLFAFSSITGVITACKLISSLYEGNNSLYKDSSSDSYILALTRSVMSTAEFNRICNMLSEYSTPDSADGAVLAFLEEHCEILLANDAVKKLAF
jgi:adapter protein MecA 1/2